jgi:tetratricopeptide (TPR) repeat protein
MGYWKPWKENSNQWESWNDYKKETSLVKYGADTVGKYIQTASNEQVNAINKVGNQIGKGLNILSLLTINNTIQTVNAIDKLEDKLEEVFSKTNESLSFINRKLDIQIEQQKISNLLLHNISELLRVPDSEKERQHCIELGLKFFLNAKKDSDLFADALEELLKAESLMKQDYFVLHRIGCIYLYADNFINIEKAIEYFKRAAKYSSVESDPKAVRLASVLTSNFNSPNTDVNNSIDKIQSLTADSYEKAAFASYVLGDFNEAVLNQNKAFKYNPVPQNQFLLAKYQIRNGNIGEAIENLNQAIDINPNLLDAIIQLRDLDIAGEPEVTKLIENKVNKIDNEIEELIAFAKKINSIRAIEIAIDLDKIKSDNIYSRKLTEFKKNKDELNVFEKKIESTDREIDDQINRLLDKNHYRTFNESKRNQFISSLKELKEFYTEEALIQLEKIKDKIRIDFDSDLYNEGLIVQDDLEFRKFTSLIKYKLISIQNASIYSLTEIEIHNLLTELEEVSKLSIKDFSKIKNRYSEIIHTFEQARIKIGSKFVGGIVFHIDKNGRNGLVVAEVDVCEPKEFKLTVDHPQLGRNTINMKGHSNWGGTGIIGTSEKIGTGKNNTQIIVEKASWNLGLFSKKPVQTAARLCSEWNHNGYNDWYLPSIEELKLIFNTGLMYTEENYWSSSEFSADRAYYYEKYSSKDMPKDRVANVRAIRSF